MLHRRLSPGHLLSRDYFFRSPRVALRTLLLAMTALLPAAAPAVTPQKPPPVLRSGEVVDLRGTLVVEHRGWQQFLVLRSGTPYELVPHARAAFTPPPARSAPPPATSPRRW